MRRIAIFCGIICGVLILGFAALWVLANPNRHRERIQARLENQLGRSVTLGEMSLGFLPLRFQVMGPQIAEDPSIAENPQPFIQADGLDVQVRLLPLLRGSIQIDSVELARPRIELIRTKDGTWNFSSLGSRSDSAPDAGAAEETSAEFALARLTIADGQIGVTDLQQGTARSVYDHVNLTLSDYAPGKPFSFDLAAQLQGDATTGVLSGQGEVSNQPGIVTSNGRLNINDAQVNGIDIGYPIQLDYRVAVDTTKGLVTIDDSMLQLGATPLTVAGTLNTSPAPVNMDLRVRSGEVSIAEVARLASAFGIAFAPGVSVAGRVSADIAARGPAARPVLTGTIAGRDLQIAGQGIPQQVQVKVINLTLTPNAIQSNEFEATSGKTTVTSRFSLLRYNSTSPVIDVALRSPGASLPEIHSIAKAYGFTGLDQVEGAGTLSLDLRASGSLDSLNTASALRAMNGVIDLDFSPIKVLGFDSVYELATLAGFASSLEKGNATEILKMTGRILVKNGVAQSDNLRMDLSIGSLAGAGTADLAEETLNMKVAAVFSKAFSDKVGATRGGGFMKVAFSNAAGEIILPAIITGTLHQPKFAPDLRTLAEMQRQRFLPNVLDVLRARPQNSAAPASEEEKPSAIRNLLDVLGGRRNEPQP